VTDRTALLAVARDVPDPELPVLTLGDLGTRDGLLGGINAVIVGNYLTTLGRDPKQDLALLADLRMPIKSLTTTL